MFVCTTVLYEYMKSLRIDVFNLFVNTYVRIKIYREFYQCIIYIANEGRHVRIIISSCIFRPTRSIQNFDHFILCNTETILFFIKNI